MGHLQQIGIGVGFGLSVLFYFSRYAFPKMPRYFSWPGMAIGIIIILVSLWPKPSPLNSESYPGFSATIALKIKDASTGRRQYIFQYNRPNNVTAAFYFSDTADRMIFALTDAHGEVNSLDFPIGAIPLYRFIFLTCQVGLGTSATYFQVLVNGEEVQKQELPFRLDLSYGVWQGTIGADKNGQNNAAFESLAISSSGHDTLTSKILGAMLADVRKFLAPRMNLDN